MKEKIYRILPNFLQNLMIFLYNRKAYAIRYGGMYSSFRKEKKKNRTLSLEELQAYQAKRYANFIKFVMAHSPYYCEKLSKIENVTDISNINKLPITSKEELRRNIKSIVAKTNDTLRKAKTGGTTGKSLEVYNFARNSQERFAFLDDFRSRFGYELGKKTAWFSGKDLLTKRDVLKKRFWKTDQVHNVRYYSTFHIKQDYLKYYLENLIKFRPEYMVGFPSTMLEIAKYGLTHSYNFPADTIIAIFPTAETITLPMRRTIENFFKSKIFNQYASSEGAPFIFECIKGNLHLELQSGVFEVLDDNNEPSQSGRLIVTSLINEGTPLIRYDIGDSIILEKESKTCDCGNNNPLVKEILGRVDDFIYSPENGKINLGNISNTLKGTKGIIIFKVIQKSMEEITVLTVVDKNIYNKHVEKVFINNWRNRIGTHMKLNISYVEDIPVQKSGKFRIVDNQIKHLV